MAAPSSLTTLARSRTSAGSSLSRTPVEETDNTADRIPVRSIIDSAVCGSHCGSAGMPSGWSWPVLIIASRNRGVRKCAWTSMAECSGGLETGRGSFKFRVSLSRGGADWDTTHCQSVSEEIVTYGPGVGQSIGGLPISPIDHHGGLGRCLSAHAVEEHHGIADAQKHRREQAGVERQTHGPDAVGIKEVVGHTSTRVVENHECEDQIAGGIDQPDRRMPPTQARLGVVGKDRFGDDEYGYEHVQQDVRRGVAHALLGEEQIPDDPGDDDVDHHRAA